MTLVLRRRAEPMLHLGHGTPLALSPLKGCPALCVEMAGWAERQQHPERALPGEGGASPRPLLISLHSEACPCPQRPFLKMCYPSPTHHKASAPRLPQTCLSGVCSSLLPSAGRGGRRAPVSVSPGFSRWREGTDLVPRVTQARTEGTLPRFSCGLRSPKVPAVRLYLLP